MDPYTEDVADPLMWVLAIERVREGQRPDLARQYFRYKRTPKPDELSEL